MKNITVIGGGSVGIASASDFAEAGHYVTLFDLEHHGGALREIMKHGQIHREGYGPTGNVASPYITFDAQKALDSTEFIFIAAVANRHQELCETIAPYLRDGQVVCFLNGNCSSILLKRMMGSKKLLVGETVGSYASVRYRGNGNIWYAGSVPSPKAVSAFPSQDNEAFVKAVFDVYPCVAYPEASVKNVIEAALNAPNVAVHLVASVVNVAAMERSSDFRLYRDGLSPAVVKLISAVERERDAVFDAFGYRGGSFAAMMEDCLHFEKAPKPHLEGFRLTTGPSGVTHRYITEDAFAGNSLLASMGELCGVQTPIIRACIHLASELNGIDFYNDGVTLDNLGLSGLSVEQINEYLYSGGYPK